jgi:Peptidase family M28
MKWATFRARPDETGTLARTVEESGAWWVQFGDDLFVFSSDRKWREVRSRIAASAARHEEPGDVRRGHLNLVMQKGRLFQNAYPDISILLDKGRYLVADIDPRTVREIGRPEDPCFRIEPLPGNEVVFRTMPRPPTRIEPDTGVASLVGALDLAAVQSGLTHLVSYPTRLSTSGHFAEAATWAANTLTSLGYSTDLKAVTVGASGQSLNVIATRSGRSGQPRRALLIVGHLDSINQPGGPGAPAPGADDNASGSVGVLELARAISAHAFTHDLTFVLFGGEEQGLHGSQQYVAALPQSERDRIDGVINMDMIGTLNTPEPTVLLEGAALSQDLIDRLADAAMTYTNLAVQISLRPFASDHVPFIEAGVPAVLTIEGADSANEAIHTANDVLARLDAGFAVEILKMNVACIAILAGLQKPAVPAPRCGCGQVSWPSSYVGGEMLGRLNNDYQHLFAQYSRLHNGGRLQAQDYLVWQEARRVHGAFARQSPPRE